MKTVLLFAAAAVPAAASAQAIPGMVMPGMSHPAHPAPPKAKAKPTLAKPKAPPPAAGRRAPRRAAAPAPAPSSPAMPAMPGMAPSSGQSQVPDAPAPDHQAMDQSTMDHSAMAPGPMDHEMAGHGAMAMDGMSGALGHYAMTRDASGTSWQPDSAPHSGLMAPLGDGWSGMAHGSATLVSDRQGGPRGATKVFVASMLMGMAQRPLGAGTLTLKGMVSLDPLMGKRGYPLLLASGETADGQTELVDRQHPHDALAELSATISQPLGPRTDGFVYLAYPGEPALGPTTYLHRFSGMANPEAPISHHFLDSTHISFGVTTAGVRHGPLKLEGSLFTGREPDQHRWDVERPRFDSWSLRASVNPSPDWSLQVSHARLHSPEGLHPDEDVARTTASATWNRALGDRGNWQTTLAWGRNRRIGGDHGGRVTSAVLLESAVELDRWGAFARAERADKDELFGDEADVDPLAGRAYKVGKLSLGGYRAVPAGPITLEVGGLVSGFALPVALRARYGSHPLGAMLFTRVKLGR